MESHYLSGSNLGDKNSTWNISSPKIVENHSNINNINDSTSNASIQIQTCDQRLDVAYTTLLVIIVSAGIIGNALSFIVLHLKTRKSNFNFLIKVLSIIDITLLLLLPIDRLMYKFESSHIVYLIFFLYFVDKLGGIARLASVWMLIIIAFFRYMAVCVPMKVKLYCTYKNARRCVVGILIFDLAVHMPFYFDQKLSKIENTTSDYYITVTDFGVSKGYHIYAHVVYTGCMFFVFPFLSLIFFSIQMIRTLCGNQREKYFSLPHLKNEASDVTRVVIAIIVVFLISYTPYMIWTVDSLIPGRREKLSSGSCSILLYRYTLDLFLYVNSSINFFIYLILRKQFRYSIQELFKCSSRKDRLKHRKVSVTMETELST